MACIGDALSSWSSLVVASNLLIFTDAASTCTSIHSRLSSSIHCVQLTPDCIHAEFDRPLVSCVVEQAAARAATDVIVMVNGDVALGHDLAYAIEHVKTRYERYVLVSSSQTRAHAQQMLDEVRDADSDAAAHEPSSSSSSSLNSVHAAPHVDVFVLPKKLLKGRTIPPFLHGYNRYACYTL